MPPFAQSCAAIHSFDWIEFAVGATPAEVRGYVFKTLLGLRAIAIPPTALLYEPINKPSQRIGWVVSYCFLLLRLAEHPKKLFVGQYWKVLYILVCISFTSMNTSSSTGSFN
jgi:hypothetical protein